MAHMHFFLRENSIYALNEVSQRSMLLAEHW